MTIEVLTLAQWLSPAYPVGAFAYSHGLESAIGEGWIGTAEDLQDWLQDVLTEGTGRTDCILLRAAHGGRLPLDEVNAIGLAFAASAERRREAVLQGAAFARTTSAVWRCDMPDLLYPVAVGAAAARQGIDPTLTCACYLQAMMTNLIAAAQRLMPLGQTEGQTILRALSSPCEDIARNTEDATLDDLSSCAFLSDIASMRHETQTPRMFRS